MRNTLKSTFSGSVGRLFAAGALATTLSACANNIYVPEEAVTVGNYAGAMMNPARSVSDQVMGRLTFLHYAVTHGGEELAPYFKSSPELSIIWNDYEELSDSDKEKAMEILEGVDFNKPATRVDAIDELAEILPSFDRSTYSQAKKDDSNSNKQDSDPSRQVEINARQQENGKWVFQLGPQL